MKNNLYATVVLMAAVAFSAGVSAAEIEIKMLNKGSDGTMMVFEPAFVYAKAGDTIHFVDVDKSHNVESISSMIPQGAQSFSGKMNEDLTVKLDKPGIYGYKCKPHYPMGMVGMVVVGKPTNEDAAKAATASMPSFAKSRFTKLFSQLDAQ